MQHRPNVIVAQGDAKSAAQLASELHRHCKTVYVARTPDEVRNAVPKHRADVVIVDLELLGIGEVARLHNDFGGVSIVTTHRVADEEMWSLSLQAGAVDCCFPNDLPTILASALGPNAKSRAA